MTGIYRAADRIFLPWKNGGGTTAEILCWPEGAGFDDFTLRLSTARVDTSGPFSSFPGVDRILTVLDGGNITLDIGTARHHLQPLEPFAFAGDEPCQAIIDRPVLDFNVMLRRPMAARVEVGSVNPSARFAVLLEPVAGLHRLDLVDLTQAPADLCTRLINARVLSVTLSGPPTPA